MAFYDLPEAERVALTHRAIAERRTVLERWSNLQSPESAPWSERASLTAELLHDCASVADLGCGPMQLRSYLQPGTKYIPVDVVARDSETILVDLNKETLPTLTVDGWAAIGLLEYLFDVPALLRQLDGTLVTSYNVIDLDMSNTNRLSHAWVNAYDTPLLEAEFARAGFSVVERIQLGQQWIWKLWR